MGDVLDDSSLVDETLVAGSAVVVFPEIGKFVIVDAADDVVAVKT